MLTEEHKEWYRKALREGTGAGTVGYSMEINQRMRFELVCDYLLRSLNPFDEEMGFSLLDVGCGTGDLPLWLMDHGPIPRRYVGIDVMPEMIARAQERRDMGGARLADFEGYEFKTGTVGQWRPYLSKPENKVDYAVSIAALALKPPEWSQETVLAACQDDIAAMTGCARKAVLCTLFSPWKNDVKPDEMLADPMAMWTWARQNWERVDLIHSYAPFDYALVIWLEESEWRQEWRRRTNG